MARRKGEGVMSREGITITEEDLNKPRDIRFIRKSFNHPTKEQQRKMCGYDERDEPEVKMRIINKETGLIMKWEAIIVFIIFAIVAGVFIFI